MSHFFPSKFCCCKRPNGDATPIHLHFKRTKPHHRQGLSSHKYDAEGPKGCTAYQCRHKAEDSQPCRFSTLDIQQPADVLRIEVTIVREHALIASDPIQVRH